MGEASSTLVGRQPTSSRYSDSRRRLVALQPELVVSTSTPSVSPIPGPFELRWLHVDTDTNRLIPPGSLSFLQLDGSEDLRYHPSGIFSLAYVIAGWLLWLPISPCAASLSVADCSLRELPRSHKLRRQTHLRHRLQARQPRHQHPAYLRRSFPRRSMRHCRKL